MAWLKREKAPLITSPRKDTPDGVWWKCKKCNQVDLQKTFESNLYVCPKCDHHFPCPPHERLRQFVDPGSFVELDSNLASTDPLEFADTVPYRKRLESSIRKLGRYDAFVAGEGLLDGRPVQVGSFDFEFMGGSMGAVVGEKITRLFQRSIEKRQAAIVFSSSGGARMQEGIISLMQMAKTCAMLGQFRENGIPFFSILTHPTTGGVAASFAMLGDINIGEPKALIGFAGPRVIQQTIREELPKDFQRSEYLLEHGMLDMICHRSDLRARVLELLDTLLPR